MEKLRFYARGNLLVNVPGLHHPSKGGTIAQYVNRKMETKPGEGFLFPAQKGAFEIPVDSREARRLAKRMRREHCLWPADKATAEACRVPFVSVELVDGEWVPKETEQAKAKADAKSLADKREARRDKAGVKPAVPAPTQSTQAGDAESLAARTNGAP
jgi:hypothetical protein